MSDLECVNHVDAALTQSIFCHKTSVPQPNVDFSAARASRFRSLAFLLFLDELKSLAKHDCSGFFVHRRLGTDTHFYFSSWGSRVLKTSKEGLTLSMQFANAQSSHPPFASPKTRLPIAPHQNRDAAAGRRRRRSGCRCDNKHSGVCLSRGSRDWEAVECAER